MKFSAQLDVSVVAVEADDEVAVLIDLTAPGVQRVEERPPATLQIVLDRSGSMAGPPLNGVIKALCGLVEQLDSRDNFGVVAFDDTAEIVVPAGRLVHKTAVINRLKDVVPGGMTDLSAGYLRGLQEAKRVAGADGATVLIVSDGHANGGIVDPVKLGEVAAKAAGERIVTSTLGYGLGYDETLLAAVSRGGSGNHHFSQDPDAAGAAIASEVEELLAKTVQAASLTVTFEPAVELLQVYNDLPSTQIAPGTVMIELGDFYAEEQRKLLLRFRVPAMAALGLATVARLELRYVELPDLVEQVVTLPVAVNVVPGDEAAGRVPDPTVRTEVLFQEAQQSKKLASEALERGDRELSGRLFREASAKLGEAGAGAPLEMQGELTTEVQALDDLRSRASWDDTSLMSKTTRASFHQMNRKRGRLRPVSSQDEDTDD